MDKCWYHFQPLWYVFGVLIVNAQKEVRDEEKDINGATNGESETVDEVRAMEEKVMGGMLDEPLMTNIFSWQDLMYNDWTSGEEKTLLIKLMARLE